MLSGLYVHVPFCIKKCPYCGFYSVPNNDKLAREYVRAVPQELTSYRHLDFSTIKTVYIGGGTPTALRPEQLEQLLSHIGERVVAEEYTIEANPGTVEMQNLHLVREQGVNRISLGVQSFRPDTLQILGRIHTPEQALTSVERIHQAGFANLNLDLMFAVPGQTLEHWQQDLARATALGPEHISLYGLTVEKGTAFRKAELKKKLTLPAEEEYAQQYAYACDYLPAAGYQQYEISNFARPGYQCRHNLNYWKRLEYLGIGPAAHSLVGMRRWWNVSRVEKYIDMVTKGKKPVDRGESLSLGTMAREFIFLSLRTQAGLSVQDFNRRFKRDFQSEYKMVIDKLVSLKYLQVKGDRISLTKPGWLVSDSVFTEFM